jgi:hypothetical protein
MSLLPTKPTEPKNEFEFFTTLVYGAPKTGKSTLASQFDKPLFLATEAGLNSLETYNIPIDSWETFTAACAEIAGGKHTFKTVVIDTVDNLWNYCSAYICKKNGIQHESELDWGKGWKLVKDEFRRAITKLSLLPYGLVIISHAEASEIKTRTGSINKWMPTMAKQAREIILPICDFIFYVAIEDTAEGEKRVVRTKPSENWEGGDRTGRMPEELAMSYEAIQTAFKEATALEKPAEKKVTKGAKTA